MSNATDLIAKYFPTPPSLPSHDDIADAKTLGRLRSLVVTLMHPVHAITLTGRERHGLPPASTAEQRSLSLAYVRLLLKHPELASKAGIDVPDFQRIVDKDEGLEVLGYSLSQLQISVGDAQLLLSAALSQGTLQVIDLVRKTVHDESVPRDQRDRIGISFGSVDLSLLRLRTMQKKREQRRARTQKSFRERLDATIEEAGLLPKIARLRRDALTDRGLATPIPRRKAKAARPSQEGEGK